ncbi:30S ribosomal protein S6 [Rickettsiales bacterium LUAb2]
MNNYYEMVYIARGELTPAQITTLNNSITEIVVNNGGKVTKTENWGLKNFAYRIKKRNKGHYCLLNLETNSAALKELDHKMKLNDSVLRTLVIKVDELDNSPSIMMRKNNFKDENKYDRNSDEQVSKDTNDSNEAIETEQQ